MKTYKLIILDFDGTVGDTSQVIVKTFQDTLRTVGLPEVSAEACRKTIGLPLVEGFKHLLPLTDEQAQACANVYHGIFEENKSEAPVPVFPGVIDAIRRWHGQGSTITIASSRGHRSLEAFVKEMDLEDYIAYILGAEDVERAKPDPCPVLKTLAHFGIAAEDTMVIGDMHFDILMGKGAGCHTCGVTYGNGTREELAEAGAEFIVDTLENF
jgi:HAD superfamily hydrolase (TIGR01509 family)